MTGIGRIGWFALGFASCLLLLGAGAWLFVASALVIPQFMTPAGDGTESALLSDLQTVRSQLELYKIQHNEKLPHLDELGNADMENFTERLTERTELNGRLAPDGTYGPYLQQIPSNHFAKNAPAGVLIGKGPPPGDGSTGWYFNTETGAFHANDPKHKDL